MPRLTKQVVSLVPPIQRRQERIETLQRQLDAKDQEIQELKHSHAESLQRSRAEAAKWRRFTRSKAEQLEAAHSRVREVQSHRSTFSTQIVNYKATYSAMAKLKDPANLVMRQIPYKLRNYSFAQSHGVSVPEVFDVWSDPAEIDLSTLNADRIVLKADSEASGRAVWPLIRDGESWAQVGSDTRIPNGPLHEALVDKMRAMRGPFFAEEFLVGAGDAELPEDIKLYMAYGQVLQVLVMQQGKPGNTDRQLFTRAYFNESGKDLGRVLNGARYASAEPPSQLTELVKIAKRLSRAVGVPFIRVDLYQTPNGPVLGELTLLPGGHHEYTSKHDRQMGKKWTAARARLERDIAAGRPPGMLFGAESYDWHYPEDSGRAGEPNRWPVLHDR